jgi:hypothetical protein
MTSRSTAVVYVKKLFILKSTAYKKENNEYLYAAAILSRGQIPGIHWKR